MANIDRAMDLIDLKRMIPEEIGDFVIHLGQKAYLSKYIFSFIHSKSINDIEQISPLPRIFRQQLADSGYWISNLKLVETFTDPDGTIKYLFELPDGPRIESVLLVDQTDRRTLCISTQAGCRMACSFCATGKLKFNRDLTAAEIVDQLYQVEKHAGTINNIVYMGMGEPFDNYDETLRSIHLLNHPDGRNIGQRHITVSTCGIPETIERFAEEDMQVRLAISLHAPTDERRHAIMPVTRRWPIARLIEAIETYQQRTGRRVTFEYCLIRGVNDSDDDARRLIRLIATINTSVNLIEYNPHPGCGFVSSDKNHMQHFRNMLTEAGIETLVRYKRGRTIHAACGQLGADWLQPGQS